MYSELSLVSLAAKSLRTRALDERMQCCVCTDRVRLDVWAGSYNKTGT